MRCTDKQGPEKNGRLGESWYCRVHMKTLCETEGKEERTAIRERRMEVVLGITARVGGNERC